MKVSLSFIAALLVVPPTLSAADLTGRFVFEGEIPEVELLITGRRALGGPICNNIDVPNESLVIHSKNRGIANIVVFLARSPHATAKESKTPISFLTSGLSNGSKPNKAEVSGVASRRDRPIPREAQALGCDEIIADVGGTVEEPAVFEIEDCRFTPRVMVIPTGRQVVVKSNDPVPHSLRSSFLRNQSFNITMPGVDRVGVSLGPFAQSEPLPMPVKSDIHPFMQAYWVVLDHPYAAVTDGNGEFHIAGLPDGTHEFRVWHERAGYIDRSLSVTIENGQGVSLSNINVDAEKLANE